MSEPQPGAGDDRAWGDVDPALRHPLRADARARRRRRPTPRSLRRAPFAATGAVRCAGRRSFAGRRSPSSPRSLRRAPIAAPGAAVRDPGRLPRRLAGAAGGHLARRTTDAEHHVRRVPPALRPARPADPGAARPHPRGRVVLRRHRSRQRQPGSVADRSDPAGRRPLRRDRRGATGCAAATEGDATCATLGVTSTTTLLELDIDPDAAAILAEHPDLRRIPLAANIAVFVDAPVLDARLNELNLFATGDRSDQRRRPPWPPRPRVGSVRIADIPVDDTNPDDGGYGRRDLVVDCSGAFTCPSGSTLADAAAAGALVPGGPPAGRRPGLRRPHRRRRLRRSRSPRSPPPCRRPSTSTT